MSDLLNNIANYVLTGLTALAIWFFKQLQAKQTKEEAKEMEAQLRSEIKELRSMIEKQQDIIYNQLATKADLQNLKDYIKDLLSAVIKDMPTK